MLWIRGSAFSLTFYSFGDREITRLKSIHSGVRYVGLVVVPILVWFLSPVGEQVVNLLLAIFISAFGTVTAILVAAPYIQKWIEKQAPKQLRARKGYSKIEWNEITSITMLKSRLIIIESAQCKYSLYTDRLDFLNVEEFIGSHYSGDVLRLKTRRFVFVSGAALLISGFVFPFVAPSLPPFLSVVGLLFYFSLIPVSIVLLIVGFFVPKGKPKPIS